MPEIMEGKNVADFIDPDIEEKLEALEREEERLAAEGFYDDNSDLELNSDDEREAEALGEAKERRLESQDAKKATKNHARLPRTAGMRTLTELSEGLTKAGFDPSRIEERATLIAKARGAAQKRKRADEDAEMDVDMDGEEPNENEWMDVDGAETTPQKRVRGNSGAVIARKNKREPRTNRQFAGMRDDAVGPLFTLSMKYNHTHLFFAASIQSRQATESWPARTKYACESWRERSCYQSQNGKRLSNIRSPRKTAYQFYNSPSICLLANARWAKRTDVRDASSYILLFLYYSVVSVVPPFSPVSQNVLVDTVTLELKAIDMACQDGPESSRVASTRQNRQIYCRHVRYREMYMYESM